MHAEPLTQAVRRSPEESDGLRRLTDFVRRRAPLFVLTGAGCSTESGIPDYRDLDGEWKHAKPVSYQDFMREPAARQRYWSRSMIGWPRINGARPNAAHRALAALEVEGVVSDLVTQNVDGLHQEAGHVRVVELHGSIDTVRCMGCGHRTTRSRVQSHLVQHNPDRVRHTAPDAPDGDARIEDSDLTRFMVPDCLHCGGILKPDVVFFGESVPRKRVERAFASLKRARGLLVVGSSLVLFSGFRFCRFAAENNIPMAAINLGRTRADGGFEVKLRMRCTAALRHVLTSIDIQHAF